jgi:small subunit ribosomal protein S6
MKPGNSKINAPIDRNATGAERCELIRCETGREACRASPALDANCCTGNAGDHNLKLYEGMFILNDARCTEDYDGTVNAVHEILTKQGAEIVDSRKWDERKLAYPVRRQQRGVYVLIHFNAPTDAISQIERQLRLANEVVLRSLIVVDEDGVSLGAEKEAERAARETRKAEIAARKAQEIAEEAETADKQAEPAEQPGGEVAEQSPETAPADQIGSVTLPDQEPDDGPGGGADAEGDSIEDETEQEDSAQQQESAEEAETTEKHEEGF